MSGLMDTANSDRSTTVDAADDAEISTNVDTLCDPMSQKESNDMEVLTKEPADLLLPKNARLWTLLTMIGYFLASFVFVLMHHIFLSQLNDQDVGHYSQFWIRSISNGTAMAVAFLLGISVTSSLTQGAWRLVATHSVSIRIIDDLFSLPSPLSILSLFFRPPILRTLLLLFIAIYLQLLVLVSTFAPNALTVGPKTVNLEIPGPNLNLLESIDLGNLAAPDVVQYMMKTSPAEIWTVPPECASACTFKVTYTAPALSCTTLEQNLIPFQPYNSTLYLSGGWPFYNCTFSRISEGPWLYANNRSYFNVTYAPFTSHSNGLLFPDVEQTGPVGRQACTWLANITYIATFSYSNYTKSVVTTPASRIPFPACTPHTSFDGECGPDSRLASVFYRWFQITYQGQLALTPGLLLGQSVFFAPFTLTDDTANGIRSFEPHVADVGRALEESFANLTLGMMLQLGSTEPVSATVEIGSVWKYSWATLWAVYFPNLLVALLLTAFGVYLVLTGELTMDRSFSTYFMTTRTTSSLLLRCLTTDVLKQEELYFDEKARQLVSRGILETNNVGYIAVVNDEPAGDKDTVPVQSQETAKLGGIIIIVATLAATVLAVVHHLFLAIVGGYNIHDTPQFWIKNASNAFSQAVSICLAVSAGCALDQLVWKLLSCNGLTIGIIDKLFRLPSPQSILPLLPYLLNRRIFTVILSALVIQALTLVTIVAPNALTVSFSALVPTSIEIPDMDLSKSFNFEDGIWRTLLVQSAVDPLNETISTPAGCGTMCSFEMEYQAPALSCRDLSSNEKAAYITNDQDSRLFYSFDQPQDITTKEWNNVTTPVFTLFYIPLTIITHSNDSVSLHDEGEPTGAYCSCVDAMHRASFQYSNKIFSINTAIISYDTNSSCTWSNPNTLSQDCINYSHNSWAICQGFIKGHMLDINEVPGQALSVDFWQGKFILSPMVNWIESEYHRDDPVTLSSKYTDLKGGLTELFSNATLGLIPTLNQTTTVSAKVWDGQMVWLYDQKTLWYAYGPALFLCTMISFYGLYCMRLLIRESDRKFSTIMITTNSKELDELYRTSTEREELMETELIYDEAERRFIVANMPLGERRVELERLLSSSQDTLL